MLDPYIVVPTIPPTTAPIQSRPPQKLTSILLGVLISVIVFLKSFIPSNCDMSKVNILEIHINFSDDCGHLNWDAYSPSQKIASIIVFPAYTKMDLIKEGGVRSMTMLIIVLCNYIYPCILILKRIRSEIVGFLGECKSRFAFFVTHVSTFILQGLVLQFFYNLIFDNIMSFHLASYSLISQLNYYFLYSPGSFIFSKLSLGQLLFLLSWYFIILTFSYPFMNTLGIAVPIFFFLVSKLVRIEHPRITLLNTVLFALCNQILWLVAILLLRL